MPNQSTFALVVVGALLVSLVPALAAQGIGPAIVVDPGSLSLTEGDAGASYRVSLGSPPTAAVVVTITGGTGDLSVTPSSLTFPAGSTAAQTVTVTPTNDNGIEGTESPTLLHRASSQDPAYNGKSATLGVTITDNDLGIVLLHGGSDATGTTVAESGAQDTIRVALGAAPAGTVAVRLTPDPQLSVSTLTLTFTAANWKTVRDVTLAAANDQVAQGTRSKLVSATASSSQASYNGATSSLAATIVDDDVAGYQFTAPGQASLPANTVPTLAFAEGSESSFTLRLTSRPTAAVTIGLGGTSGATTVPSSLTFTASTWSTPQTVRVQRAQDVVDQGATYLVTAPLSASSTDANYRTVPGPVTATVTDDDVADVVLSHTGGGTEVREGGPGDTFTTALATQPMASVTVALTSPSGLALTPSSLTFTAASWSTPQSVAVTAVDDAAAGLPRSVVVTASASGADAIYSGKSATLPVAILDDDGVLEIVETAGSTAASEDGAGDTITVRLIGEPAEPVTVTLTASDGGQFTVDGAAVATLTFDPGVASVAAPCSADPARTCRWNQPQVVQVAAVDDHVIDGTRTGTIAFATSSADPAFDGQASRPVGVSVADTDVAALLVDGRPVAELPPLAVSEGGSRAYEVTLTSIPASPVTVALTGIGGASVSPASLTFDGTTWDQPQAVTVSVPRDFVDQGIRYTASVRHTTTSADAHFTGLVAVLPVDVMDHPDDIAGWLFSAAGQTGLARNALPSLAFAEGQAAPYTVRLASKPTADVVLNVVGSGGSLASPSSLRFTAANWASPQSVTAAVAQDKVDQGTTYAGDVGQAAASSDAFYASVPGPVSVVVTDDDVAALVWSHTGGSSVVAEGGAGDVVKVALASKPTAAVTIAVSVAQDLSVTPSSLTFSPDGWNVAQSVSVTAVDDDEPEFTESRPVSGMSASSDPFYAGLRQDIAVSVLDDDGVLIVQPSGTDTTAQEGGATDTYTVRLIWNPTSRVTVTVGAGGDQVRVDGASSTVLTFEPGSGMVLPARCHDDPTATCQWDHPQTVTVSAVDDALVEGSMASIITHTVSSADKRYDGVPSAAVHAVAMDNDRGVLLLPTDGGTRVLEGGAADTYTVALSMPPALSVAVLVEAPAGLAASPDTLFFDAETWAIPQEVTLVAVDDQVDRGTRVLHVAHRTSSADDSFNGLDVPLLAVTVFDDDGGGHGGGATGTVG